MNISGPIGRLAIILGIVMASFFKNGAFFGATDHVGQVDALVVVTVGPIDDIVLVTDTFLKKRRKSHLKKISEIGIEHFTYLELWNIFEP